MDELIVYDIESKQVTSKPVDATPFHLKKNNLMWLDVNNPSEKEFELISEFLGLHDIVKEEYFSEMKLPRIAIFPNQIFIVWEVFPKIDSEKKIQTSWLYFVIFKNCLLTIHKENMPQLEEIKYAVKADITYWEKGVARIQHEILDRFVDDCFITLDNFSEAIESLENRMFEDPTRDDLRKLFFIKHELMVFRKGLAPQREIVNSLMRHGNQIFNEEMRVFYQDVYDHLVRLVDLIDTSRDLISSAMDIYLSGVSNKLNTIMKTLTIIATIMMSLTVITGIYGMNFNYMPELEWRYGYFTILAVMFSIVVAMLIIFRWKKWL